MNLKALLSRLVRREAAANPAANPALLEARDPAIITLISIIFSTAPQTFAGSASLVTMATPLATSRPTSLASGSGLNLAGTSSTKGKSTSTSSGRSSSSSSSMSTTSAPTTSSTPPPSAAPITSKTPSPTAAPSHGMSTGGKVGLAFGLILLFLLVIAGAIALYRRRKYDNDNHQRLDDEKSFFAAGRNPNALPAHDTPLAMGATSAGAAGAATMGAPRGRPVSFEAQGAETLSVRQSVVSLPQLSVRAVSSFNPGLPTDTQPVPMPAIPPTNYAAMGAMGAGAAATRNVSPPQSSHANDPNNPFGSHAEKLSGSPPQDVPLPVSPIGSFHESSNTPAINAADFPLPDTTPATPAAAKSDNATTAVVAGAAAGAGAAAIMAATAAAASNRPQGAAPPPAGPAGDVVHRVQLDFKPSMDDELEIHAGQLVRVLHEYDDGWALCIRMDRSQQGVVPRTCLSKHPVKPRPASPAGRRGPPIRGPGGPGFGPAPGSGRNSPSPYGPGAPRPLSPSGRNSPGPGRMSPAGGRMSPAPYGQAPRPLTPTSQRQRANSNAVPYPTGFQQPRSMSPGPYGGSRLRPQEAPGPKRRSNSMSNIAAPGTPGSPAAAASTSKLPTAKVNRKPVPSQGSTASS